MTDKKPLSQKTLWQIACILRRAAGLPDCDLSDTVWREDGSIANWSNAKHRLNLYVFDLIPTAWQEDTPAAVGRLSRFYPNPRTLTQRSPLIISCLYRIDHDAGGWERNNPKLLAKELYSLRYSLRDLRQRILSLDKESDERMVIDHYGDPFIQWFDEPGQCSDEERSRKLAEYEELTKSPLYYDPTEGILEYIDRFEAGLTGTLEDVEADARDRKDMGQPRTYAAKRVAFEVARYMYTVNGKIPGFWVEANPSTPYAKAVLEIYDILGIPSGSFEKAGAWAIAKLKSDPSFEVLQK